MNILAWNVIKIILNMNNALKTEKMSYNLQNIGIPHYEQYIL